MKKFIAEFKKFALRGNVIDLAVGVIIGGAFGMDERVKKASNFRLSVSKMTFTHRMMRVILAEQIYRALNILSGGNYHK